VFAYVDTRLELLRFLTAATGRPAPSHGTTCSRNLLTTVALETPHGAAVCNPSSNALDSDETPEALAGEIDRSYHQEPQLYCVKEPTA
jgi:hypothetical protein